MKRKNDAPLRTQRFTKEKHRKEELQSHEPGTGDEENGT
jgi:hypothetical protein